MRMPDRLLDEFPPITKTEWLDRVKVDLKGKPIEKLTRISESGIPIAPIYTAEDLPAGVEKSFPGQDDLRRGDNYHMGVSHLGWLVCQDLGATALADFATFVARFEADDHDGRSALRIVLGDPFRQAFSATRAATAAGGLLIDEWTDLEAIVAWANSKAVQLHIEAGDAAIDFLDSGLLGRISGSLDLNPLGYGKHGIADESLLTAMLPRIATVLSQRKVRDDFNLFTISLQGLALTGADATQQIAYAVAMATDLADRLGKFGVTPQDVFSNIAFQFPISTDFFGEISKLRAFRIVWGRILEAWGLQENPGKYTCLQGITAIANETVADPHVNLLRHTTQCMAAAMGGCGMVILPAYDAQYEVPTDDALRIARNIQLVLKKEAYLANIVDPAGGSYFVEHLTDAMASQAWGIFQEIEAAGGWYTYLQKDLLAPILTIGLRKRMAAVRTSAKTVLGTNHFPNELETMHPQNAPVSHTTNSAILGRLETLGDLWGIANPELESSRLAAEFEAIRFKMQEYKGRYNGIQNALLLTHGDPLMRAARATFARNVLGSGGYLCTENAHPTDLQAAVAAAVQLQPSVIVLCGADADYIDQGSAWLQAIHAALPQAIFILAGKPEGWEALKADGITEPVFAGMDRVAFLERLFEQVHTRKEARP